ncbi:unnamed protein product [Prorocentrum cordatum]|nr:unnamed protein product [Polarella glacialis]
MTDRTDEKVRFGFLALFEKQHLCDVTIVSQDRREIHCHKAILASQSEWFSGQLGGGAHATISLDHKYKVVRCLVRFMYFGGIDSELNPEDALDLLLLAQELQVQALDEEDVAKYMKEPCLTPQNSIAALTHHTLERYPRMQEEICMYVGDHFSDMLNSMESQLLAIPLQMLASVLRAACLRCATDVQADRIMRFCLAHTQLDSACDLLRETKQWRWGAVDVNNMRSPPGEAFSEGREWKVDGVRESMEVAPARIVEGVFFDWCIRLDYGAEDRLRIVYESATPRDGAPRCVNRFPAAMFAWTVMFRGQDVFQEKPVFICFPENVSLHWSTSLPVSAAELSDSDDLRIEVRMAENPMLSLILYHFSNDLKTTVTSEDILNRLPHIEYRCLSSYSLVKTHVSP